MSIILTNPKGSDQQDGCASCFSPSLFDLSWEFNGPVNITKAMSSLSVYLRTLCLDGLSPLSGLSVLVYILSPEFDICHFSVSGRQRMAVEKISRSISAKECCRYRLRFPDPAKIEPATS